MIDEKYKIQTCSCCGGDLPAVESELDKYDCYLVRDDGYCTGSLRVNDRDEVLGCGAWKAAAYEEEE